MVDATLKQEKGAPWINEKEKTVMDEIVASNHITVADDFVIPPVSDEQIQELMKKQMPQQMPEDAEIEQPDAKKTDTKKPAPKKK